MKIKTGTYLKEPTNSDITFCVNDPKYVCPKNCIFNPPNIEILKLSKKGFFYKGKRVDDIHNVYKRFNEWLNLAEKSKIK